MYYKAMNNDTVADLLRKICYVRYLPKSKRWVTTDSQSAHGIMSSDGNAIFYLAGRSQTCEEPLTAVSLHEIDEAEYERLAMTWAMQKRETEDLREEISELKSQLDEQSSLLQAILAKL